MNKIGHIRREVFEKKPLIHSITNPISINQCANTILAVGARPIMAEHPKEVGEITDTADALMLNLGNITDARMESMLISAKMAEEKGIPIVLDAVGVACSALRRKYALSLIEKVTPTVIKGNYSEIRALYDEAYSSVGVDADMSLEVDSVRKLSHELSARFGAVIMATGARDIITDGARTVYINNGVKQLSTVTGTGCMLGALCAAFMTSGESFDAVVAATAFFGICGELSETEKGNGTFMVNLIDNISTADDELIERYAKVEKK